MPWNSRFYINVSWNVVCSFKLKNQWFQEFGAISFSIFSVPFVLFSESEIPIFLLLLSSEFQNYYLLMFKSLSLLHPLMISNLSSMSLFQILSSLFLLFKIHYHWCSNIVLALHLSLAFPFLSHPIALSLVPLSLNPCSLSSLWQKEHLDNVFPFHS